MLYLKQMKSIYKNKKIIGTDESGVGDYFTPLVGASVYLTYEQALELEKIGVTDSKLLSDKQCSYFAMKIKALNQHEIHFLSPKGFNKLNTFLNGHELKTLIHLTTINKLLNKFTVDEIIVDKYVEEKKWHEYETKLNSSVLKIPKVTRKIIFVHKGEMEHVAVAAASIVARNFLLYKMKFQNQDWNTVFPLGASKQVVQFGKEFVKINGKDALNNVAKVSFKTTKDILGE